MGKWGIHGDMMCSNSKLLWDVTNKQWRVIYEHHGDYQRGSLIAVIGKLALFVGLFSGIPEPNIDGYNHQHRTIKWAP